VTDSITDWLHAQLDEDATAVRQADSDLAATLRKAGRDVADEYGDAEPPEEGVSTADRAWWIVQDAANYIARHDPARVLREIDADRELLSEYSRLLDAHAAHQREAARLAEAGDDADVIQLAALRREADYLPAMLHVLERWAKRKAAVYAGRPGYRDAWRP
jgi:hypothetical protein